MSHTASKTWVSEEAKEYDNFARIRDNYLHVAPNSPFIPRSWAEWISHRIFSKEEAHTEGLRRLTITKMYKMKETKELVQPAFSGKEFRDSLSSVLSLESIWLPSIENKLGRMQAPWPTNDELKHEGAYRSTSGYCRFPPLPRVPGNATVNWKQRCPVVPFQLDEVGVPTVKKDEAVPEVDDTMVLLVGETLLKELDS
ncbi:hypothetical protein AWENTII_004568 [Aspergillus wentii]|nr:hypothetical protein MW887_010982 [Aspergillus wentii]